MREFLDEYQLPDGRRIYVVGEGRLVNLAAAEGHPSAVMDMSFANQALAAEYMLKNGDKMKGEVYDVPEDIDREIAAPEAQGDGRGDRHADCRTVQLFERVDMGTGH